MPRQNATPPAWLNPAEMIAWRSYIIASRRLLEILDSDLGEHDLSMPDYEILAQLSDAPMRRMRMSELADMTLLSRSRLSHRMKVMEKAGWIMREACPVDKRGYFAVMTPKGWRAIVAAAPAHVTSVRSHFLAHLTSAEQELIAEVFLRIEASLRTGVKDE